MAQLGDPSLPAGLQRLRGSWFWRDLGADRSFASPSAVPGVADPGAADAAGSAAASPAPRGRRPPGMSRVGRCTTRECSTRLTRRVRRRSSWSCEEAGHYRHGRRLRVLIAVLWRAGLRISEALGAQRDRHRRGPGFVAGPSWQGRQAPRGRDGPVRLRAARCLADPPRVAPAPGCSATFPNARCDVTIPPIEVRNVAVSVAGATSYAEYPNASRIGARIDPPPFLANDSRRPAA